MGAEQQVVYGVTEAAAKRPTGAVAIGDFLGSSRIWSLADQAVVSLGNFLTNVILARTLAPHDFGVYAILLGVVLFLYGAHSALVTYPLSIRGAAAPKDGLRELTTFSLWATIAVGLVFTAVLVGICTCLGQFTLGLCSAMAMFFLIIQETLRKALMAHLRFRDSFFGDAVSYLGQVGIVLLLSSMGRLSPQTTFLAMAATSAVAAGLQIVQLGIWSPYVTCASVFFGDFWRLGRWMLVNNVVGIFSTQLFPWVLAVFMGAAVAGTFQALINILGASNPIMLSAVNWILPASAKAWRDSGLQAASSVAFRYGGIIGLVLCPFFVVAMILPGRVLALFYGHNSSYAMYEATLRILVLAMAANYVAVVVSTLVNAVERSQVTFYVLVVSALCSLVIGVPLTMWKGLEGAAVAMLIGGVIRAGMISVMVGRPKFDVAKAG